MHYKPRIAVAILDLQWMKMTWNWWKIEKIAKYLLSSFMEIFLLKPLVVGK